jgi:di/tricarboxylate transporter
LGFTLARAPLGRLRPLHFANTLLAAAQLDQAIILNLDMLLVLGVLALSVLLFVTEWVAVDVAAMLLLVVLGLTGLVPLTQLFSGFASNAVISILAVMILGAGLDRTGLMGRAADFILRLAGDTERRLVLALSAVAGGISGFMQNPAVTALFLPVASRIAARTGYPLAHLLLPMAACIVLGGTMTTVGNSPMILLNDLIESTNKNLPQGAQVLAAPKLFSVFPIGLALLITGLLYFYFVGFRRLPKEQLEVSVTPRTTEAYFERLYGVTGELIELRVYPDSAIVGLTIGELESLTGAPLFLALKKSEDAGNANTQRLAPPMDELIVAGCVLAVMGELAKIERFANAQGLGVLPGKHHLGALFDATTAGVSEAVLPPSSGWIGKSAQELRIRRRYGMNLLAVVRAGDTLREGVRALKLQSGDTLIFHSAWQELSDHAGEGEFVVVTDYPKEERRPHKQGFALFFFVGGFLLAFIGHVALPIALMAGAVGMLVTGVLSTEEAYRAINWKTIFSLACLIPISIAIDQTGTAAWIAANLVAHTGGVGPIVLQVGLAVLASAAALAMGQVGATVLMVPIAINIALAANANPTPFALVVTFAASNNFMSASNPVIAMIQGPGGYQKRDLARVGMPLSVLFIVIAVTMVNALF